MDECQKKKKKKIPNPWKSSTSFWNEAKSTLQIRRDGQIANLCYDFNNTSMFKGIFLIISQLHFDMKLSKILQAGNITHLNASF